MDAALAAELATLVTLLLGSAFFSMSETALISADRLRIRALREKGDPRAARLERLLQEPEKLITTVLVGNNIVNIAASVLSAVVAVKLLGDVGAAVAAGVMVFVVLVFAEITPKTLAVRHATGIALQIAGPMTAVGVVMGPVVWFFAQVANAVLRLGGVKPARKGSFITEEEIKLLLRVGEEQGTIERFERKVISEVFDFTDTKAHRVMTPRDKIVSVNRGATLLEAAEVVNRSGYSRVLVADGTLDNVLGFLHAKDLLRHPDAELRALKVEDHVRPVVLAPATLDSDELLVRMQRMHTHLAVVQDKEGSTVGLLTVEDLLEELVGEIHDEFDVAPASTPAAAAKPTAQPEAPESPPGGGGPRN